jgi:hypothetical integral membrane protein (TIGR02206 family)
MHDPSTPAATLNPAWYEIAAAFTWIHLASVLLFVPMMIAASLLGVRWRGTPKEPLLRRLWAGTMLAFLGGVNIYYMRGDFDPAFKYPLQVCDLMGLVACLALLTDFRWLRTLTVFWGLALCTQAFITPVVKVGPVYLHWWYFWFGHVAIVGGAVYLIAVDRYRPTLADLGLACLSLSAYVGWTLPLNLGKGWNYGFTGNPPSNPDGTPAPPTIVDALGPWPDRVYWLGILACLGMTLVYLGFQIPKTFASLRRTHAAPPAD